MSAAVIKTFSEASDPEASGTSSMSSAKGHTGEKLIISPTPGELEKNLTDEANKKRKEKIKKIEKR